MTDVTLLRTNSDHNDFKKLVKLLDQDLAIRDGDDHAFYAQFNKIDAIKEVVVAFKNGMPVACGAIKPFADQATELKRMFVHPDFRNQGIATRILNELEKWALELGYNTCVLETGINQPEAIGLYQKVGYHITPNYGQYIGVQNSVCMAKALSKS